MHNGRMFLLTSRSTPIMFQRIQKFILWFTIIILISTSRISATSNKEFNKDNNKNDLTIDTKNEIISLIKSSLLLPNSNNIVKNVQNTNSQSTRSMQTFIDSSTTCSVSEILYDTCEYRFDGVCDAGSYCPSYSDCFDCDPCGILHTTCSSCMADPSCTYCEGFDVITQEPFALCATIEFAQAIPESCWLLSGNTGTHDGTTFAFGTSTCSDIPIENNNTNTDVSCDIVNDSCAYKYDGVCDTSGDSLYCNVGTDCYDCDPCQNIVTDAIASSITDVDEVCNLCTGSGCLFCTFTNLAGQTRALCTSPSIASILPQVCTSLQGSPYTDTCTNTIVATSSPSSPPQDINTLPSTCDYANDSCIFAQDKVCDAIGSGSNVFSGYCEANSDCLDCDPCQVFRFEGCDACVKAGCYWCPYDALCVSSNPISNTNGITNSFTVSSPLQLTCTNANDFVQTCPTAGSSGAIFNDPLFEAQNWVYEQIGVVDVWKSGITGAGIGIRINDIGVDANHIEFNTKFDVASSCSEYTPVILDEKHNHGTTCAAIAGGSGNNGACSVGIAPNATISSCRVISIENGEVLATELYDASYLYVKMDNMHISSNSYSKRSCARAESSIAIQGNNRRLQQCPFTSTSTATPCIALECANIDWSNPTPSNKCEPEINHYCAINFENDVEACTGFLDLFVTCDFNSITMAEHFALKKGVTEGRNGKGIIYVFSGGNEFGGGDDTNFGGLENTRFGIPVGAADKNGKHSSYSNGGASLFISAPGGDLDYYSNNIVALAGAGCIDGGAGTSFAAPVVAGVVALMLEANPELSWRDVQGILASTGTMIQPDDPSWTTNSAGLHHSNIYGFGMVNASAAVTAAKSWSLLTSEIEIVTDSGSVNMSIPEYPGEAIVSTVIVNANDTFKIESVIVYLDLHHSSRGDLNIELTSPAGTKSVLAPGRRPENSQNIERWKLLTVRNREESANGVWSLSVVDRSKGDASTCIDTLGWTLIVDDEPNATGFGCDQFSAYYACINGTEGQLFSTYFPGLTGLSDPALAGTDGLTPDVACCVCGGGLPASNLADMLGSWKIVMYGNDPGLQEGSASTLSTSGAGSLERELHWTILIAYSFYMAYHLIILDRYQLKNW